MNSTPEVGQLDFSSILDTLGLYARSIEDLVLLADIFALRDDDELPASFQVADAKFALIKTMVWPQVGAGTAAAMEKAAHLLREHGAVVEEIELPAEFDELPVWHRTVMTCDGRVSFLPDYRVAKAQLDEGLVGHVENVKEAHACGTAQGVRRHCRVAAQDRRDRVSVCGRRHPQCAR